MTRLYFQPHVLQDSFQTLSKSECSNASSDRNRVNFCVQNRPGFLVQWICHILQRALELLMTQMHSFYFLCVFRNIAFWIIFGRNQKVSIKNVSLFAFKDFWFFCVFFFRSQGNCSHPRRIRIAFFVGFLFESNGVSSYADLFELSRQEKCPFFTGLSELWRVSIRTDWDYTRFTMFCKDVHFEGSAGEVLTRRQTLLIGAWGNKNWVYLVAKQSQRTKFGQKFVPL